MHLLADNEVQDPAEVLGQWPEELLREADEYPDFAPVHERTHPQHRQTTGQFRHHRGNGHLGVAHEPGGRRSAQPRLRRQVLSLAEPVLAVADLQCHLRVGRLLREVDNRLVAAERSHVRRSAVPEADHALV